MDIEKSTVGMGGSREMSRLTRKTDKGFVFGSWNEIYDSSDFKPIVDRLAAYEDTGLEPGEVAQMSAEIELLTNGIKEIGAVCAKRHDELAAVTAERDAAIEAQRWIPVTERLPEDDVSVLTLRINGQIDIARRKNIYRYAWFINCIAHEDVTHWMPLLAPPREVDASKEVRATN